MSACKTHLYALPIPYPSLFSTYASALLTGILKTLTLCGLFVILLVVLCSPFHMALSAMAHTKPVCGGRERAGNAHPLGDTADPACCE